MSRAVDNAPVILDAVEMAFTYCRDCGFEDPDVIGDHLGVALLVEHCLLEAGKCRDWMAIDIEAVVDGLPVTAREREGLVVCLMRMLTWLGTPGPLSPLRVLEYLDRIEAALASRVVATHARYCRASLQEVIGEGDEWLSNH